MRRKSENPLFEIWYSVVAPSGGAEKNFNMGAQLQIIAYKNAQNILKIARLNSISVSTKCTAFRFGTTFTN